MKKRGGCPNQGQHGLRCQVKEGHQGWQKKSYVYAGNKGFIQLPKISKK